MIIVTRQVKTKTKEGRHGVTILPASNTTMKKIIWPRRRGTPNQLQLPGSQAHITISLNHILVHLPSIIEMIARLLPLTQITSLQNVAALHRRIKCLIRTKVETDRMSSKLLHVVAKQSQHQNTPKPLLRILIQNIPLIELMNNKDITNPLVLLNIRDHTSITLEVPTNLVNPVNVELSVIIHILIIQRIITTITILITTTRATLLSSILPIVNHTITVIQGPLHIHILNTMTQKKLLRQ
mmetsp:Transcript_33038/g.67504  ORF Transcript_33038/g.67504 Transcript_33038/m.67504 type:complete len:240 (-) Transcript_33038:784-1503(-)